MVQENFFRLKLHEHLVKISLKLITAMKYGTGDIKAEWKVAQHSWLWLTVFRFLLSSCHLQRKYDPFLKHQWLQTGGQPSGKRPRLWTGMGYLKSRHSITCLLKIEPESEDEKPSVVLELFSPVAWQQDWWKTTKRDTSSIDLKAKKGPFSWVEILVHC